MEQTWILFLSLFQKKPTGGNSITVLDSNTNCNRLLSSFMIHKQNTWFWQLDLFPVQKFGEHPNIIKLLDVIQAENDKDIYLIFESMGETQHYSSRSNPASLRSYPCYYFDSGVIYMIYMNVHDTTDIYRCKYITGIMYYRDRFTCCD